MDKLALEITKNVVIYINPNELYINSEIEVGIGEKLILVSIDDTLCLRYFKSTIMLINNVNSLLTSNNYNIFTLKAYYELIEFYTLVFAVNLVDILYNLDDLVCRSKYSSNIDSCEGEEYASKVTTLLFSDVGCKLLAKFVTCILEQYDFKLRKYDLYSTLKHYAHYASNLEYVDENLPRKYLSSVRDDSETAFIRVRKSVVCVGKATDNFYVKAPVFNSVRIYYSQDKFKILKWDNVVEKLNTINPELKQSVLIESSGFTRIILEYILDILRVDSYKIIN